LEQLLENSFGIHQTEVISKPGKYRGWYRLRSYQSTLELAVGSVKIFFWILKTT
jgi:hypothetical protein